MWTEIRFYLQQQEQREGAIARSHEAGANLNGVEDDVANYRQAGIRSQNIRSQTANDQPVGYNFWKAEDFRKIIAKANAQAGNPLPPEFFNYGFNGKPVNGTSSVRFGHFRQGFVIFGIGEAGADLVDRHSGFLHKALEAVYGKILRSERRSGRTRISRSGRLHEYRIPVLALESTTNCKRLHEIRPQLRRTPEDLKNPALNQEIRRVIASSIMNQLADLHANDATVNVDEDTGNCVTITPEDIDLVDMKGTFALPLNDNEKGKNLLFSVRGLHFRTALDLQGPWHVGRLCARGHGHIQHEGRRQ